MHATSDVARGFTVTPARARTQLDERSLRPLREIVIGVERSGSVAARRSEHGALDSKLHTALRRDPEAHLRKPKPEIPRGRECRRSNRRKAGGIQPAHERRFLSDEQLRAAPAHDSSRGSQACEREGASTARRNLTSVK